MLEKGKERHDKLQCVWGVSSQIRNGDLPNKLDVHEPVHRDTTMKITSKMYYIDYPYPANVENRVSS